VRFSLRRLKIGVSRNTTQCSLVTRRQCFGGKCCVTIFRVLRNASLSLYSVTALHERSFILSLRETGQFHPTGRQYQKQNIKLNKSSTRCKSMQSDLFHCTFTLHVSGVTAPIIRSTKNCNRSLRYRSQYRYSYFPPKWPDLATLEGSSCTDIVTCTGDCGYSF